MPDLVDLVAAKNGVPSQLLRAVGMQESGLNPNQGPSSIAPAVGGERGTGMMQLTPSTAQGLGVNPNDPAQALDGAARYLKQGFDKFGNWDDAVRYYHGGPDPKNWGTRTQANHEAVAGKIGVAPANDNPFRTDSSPSPAPIVSGDDNPFRGNSDAGVSSGSSATSGVRAFAGVPANISGGNPSGPQFRPWAQKLPAPVKSAIAGFSDLTSGVGEGWDEFQNALVRWGAKATDSLGVSHGAEADFDKIHADQAEPYQRSRYVNPEGWSRFGGNIIGESAPLAPLSELTPLKAIEGAPLASALARYGNMAIQGGIGGAILSGGKNTTRDALMGAAAAPLLGAAVEKAVFPFAGKLADALSSAKGKFLPKIEAPAGIPQFDETGAPFIGMGEAGGQQFPEYGTPDQPGARSMTSPETPPSPAPNTPSPQIIAQAMGSNGARSGIEATKALPAAVSQKAEALTAKGVPADQALREADILAIGGKPTIAQVTRDPAEQSAMWEGAKQNTPEGRALADQIAANNGALHSHIQSMVENYGGVPAHGEAIETAANALAERSNAARSQVNAAYEAARNAEGDQTISIDPLRELLATPQFKAPTDSASRELIGGIKRLSREMSGANGNRFTPDQIDQLAQAANDAYNPMGGSVNSKIGQIKGALNESLDQLEAAGPAYRNARALHRDWANKYENPQGIAGLIRTDANGNFVNADNWRKAENVVQTLADKPFVQIVGQLKADGQTEALDRLKATIVQKAYERASSNAKDKLGNSTVNGKQFFAELNKIGLPKLNALFFPDEIANLATVGRAATHLNEAVPGTVNSSNTSSALVKALAQNPQISGRTKVAARVVGHGLATALHPVVGNLAVEGAMQGAGALAKRQAATKLADALRQSMDPEASRAAQAAQSQRLASALQRAQAAKRLAQGVSGVAPAVGEKR